MKLYLKGDYTKTDLYDEFKEIAVKMWYRERNGIELGYSHGWGYDFHLNLRLNKFDEYDIRWKDAPFKKGVRYGESLRNENLTLDMENAYESDGREKGDYLRLLSSHVNILTVDKRAMYIMAIEVATAIDGQISEDDKATWLTVEEFKARHQEILSLSYDEAVDISLEELPVLDEKAVREPLRAELERRREEYIKIHGEAYYEDEDDDEEDEEFDDEPDDDGDDMGDCFGF